MFGGGVSFLTDTLKRNRKLLTVTVILIVAVFLVISNKSYAYFEKKIDASCISLEVGNLSHSLESEVVVPAGESVKTKVIVKNTENKESKYQLVYKSNDDLEGISVGYSGYSSNLPYGNLEENEEKEIIIIIENNSSKKKKIYIDVKSGLITNTVEDITLEDGEYRISNELNETVKILGRNFTVDSTKIDFSSISSETNGRGVYKYKEDNADIYYYRGKVLDNHVIFGG